VTAQGATDESGGWRSNERAGGILIDFEPNEIINTRFIDAAFSTPLQRKIVASGRRQRRRRASQEPHGFVDEQNRKYRKICRVPGFTRGLHIVSQYVLVGLSQARASVVFTGLRLPKLLRKTVSMEFGLSTSAMGKSLDP
jgi:hypothetical protein